MTQHEGITAVILAGGKGRRMAGRDKGMVELDGKPLVSHIIKAMAPQVEKILINANRNLQRYQDLGYPVVRDSLTGYQGPLAGFLSAMEAVDTADIMFVPCDGPLLPGDLVERFVSVRKRSAADIAVAHDGERLQPVYALIPARLKPELASFLASGERKIDRWYAQQRMALVDFSDMPDIFRNINTLAERDRLQQEFAAP